MPKQIQDQPKHEVGLLAYSPKLHFLVSTPQLYNFRPGFPPSFPAYIWKIPSGEFEHSLIGHKSTIMYIGFMANGEKLLTSGLDGMVVWDLRKKIGDWAPFASIPHWAILSPSGKELVSWDEDAGIIVWDAKTAEKKRVVKFTEAAKKVIKSIDEASLAISPDERYMAFGAGLGNTSIIIWDYKTGNLKAVLPHDAALKGLYFSKSGRFLFANGNEVRNVVWGNGVLDIWDTESWKLLREIEVKEWKIRQVVEISNENIVLTVDSLRTPKIGDRDLFKTLINGYSIKTGERLLSYDTNLAPNGWCTSTLYMEDINAICIGGADGKISFFSVDEVMKLKKQG